MATASRYFDAHNHFHDGRLARLDRARWLEEAAAEGLGAMVVNGTEPADWEAVLEWATRFPGTIRPSFGVHPWKVGAVAEDWESRLRGILAEAGPMAGVGEVGLDRWIPDFDPVRQETVLRAQIALATGGNRPLTIHCLRAWGPLLEVLRSEALPKRGFLIHSVGASPETIRELAALGAYFSVSGPFADPAKKKFARALAAIPGDRLLLETDAPDMLGPPAWRRGELTDPATGEAVCHPASIWGVYAFVAQTWEGGEEALVEQVATNFDRFFGAG